MFIGMFGHSTHYKPTIKILYYSLYLLHNSINYAPILVKKKFRINLNSCCD